MGRKKQPCGLLAVEGAGKQAPRTPGALQVLAEQEGARGDLWSQSDGSGRQRRAGHLLPEAQLQRNARAQALSDTSGSMPRLLT